ncbi:hypothetical protein F4553_003987 [Allocatelliglobosispora scoriae]|uniref:Uncharacterized protein n=1 Tax=Allocatelliglobosispora scoriae TaxID=643052 RepID=A0A841BT70_9ACTN|nr:hypothetical protein [Allocatelliglobosispora scoriae]MBB5870608.1 hypothetical protein [Allocatelliglobosispora scoriae]
MPAKKSAGKPAEEPNEPAESAAVEPEADETAEEPEFANRAERRAAKGKGKTASGQQQTFGKGNVAAKANTGPAQRIWSNRKAG